MEINRADVVREVTDAFERYEVAVNANDVATLNELFWNSAQTIRYGVAEELYGYDAIAGFRAARDPKRCAFFPGSLLCSSPNRHGIRRGPPNRCG